VSARPSVPTIYTEIDRRAGALSQEFAALGVATVHESQGRSGLMDPRIRPLAEGSRVAGPAVTCLNQPGDNLMLLAAMELCQPGDILVVGNLAPVAVGMVGEIIVSMLRARGVAGVVLDSGVRDVRELRRIGLPVWSQFISAAGTIKAGPGWVNVPIDVAGATVHPGDIVVADDDGGVVVPATEAEDVLVRSRDRVAREAELLERIDRGDVPGLSPELAAKLDALGVHRVLGRPEVVG
jgi:4-hydroxy-4-methyl-2-oxoglutarate aldolase